MGLFDRFKPDYKSKDWNTKRKAIRNLTDQKILMDIAQNDKDKKARTVAVDTITDPMTLFNLAKSAKYQDVAINAAERLQKLTDEENKRKASSNAKKILESATNESELEKIVLDSNVDDATRYNAIYKIDSESILYNIVVSPDTSLGFKKAAERKINDESLLCKIILDNYNMDIRKSALSKINNENKLKNLVRDLINMKLPDQYGLRDEHNKIVMQALEKIHDEKFLMNYVDGIYYESALKNIKSQEYLVEIIEKTNRYDIKAEAVKKIKDENVLVDLACNCENTRESAKFIENIVENVNDDKLLAKIVNEGPNKYKPGSNISISTIPAAKITDESILATFLNNLDVQDIAMNKIKKQSILEAIAKGNYDCQSYVRSDAIKKLTSKTVLEELAQNDDFCVVAEKRLKELGYTTSSSKHKSNELLCPYCNSTNIEWYGNRYFKELDMYFDAYECKNCGEYVTEPHMKQYNDF